MSCFIKSLFKSLGCLILSHKFLPQVCDENSCWIQCKRCHRKSTTILFKTDDVTQIRTYDHIERTSHPFWRNK
jgi:hypothetical protein